MSVVLRTLRLKLPLTKSVQELQSKYSFREFSLKSFHEILLEHA